MSIWPLAIKRWLVRAILVKTRIEHTLARQSYIVARPIRNPYFAGLHYSSGLVNRPYTSLRRATWDLRNELGVALFILAGVDEKMRSCVTAMIATHRGVLLRLLSRVPHSESSQIQLRSHRSW